MKHDVVAIVCSDLHLSHKCPVARSAEPDWYDAMERSLIELQDLENQYEVPIIIAGDIFHKANSPPELINFAIQFLPNSYSTVGQHDLIYHDYRQLYKSAYMTLVSANVLKHLEGHNSINDMHVYGFPFGFEVKPCKEKGKELKIAIIHSYIWTKDCSYPGAPIQSNVSSWKERLKGYDVAVFGDNHIGWVGKCSDCNVINCGSFIPRNIDQKDYKPFVGLIHSDGSITQHFLDISQDKWLEDEQPTEMETEHNPDLDKFLKELDELDSDSVDFVESVKHWVNDNVSDPLVKQLFEKILEEN